MASRFRALTTWTTLEVVSEPYIVMTFRGYTAALETLDVETNESYELLIGGIKSLAEGIEPIREANGGLFSGLRIKIKKESAERSSLYIIESADSISAEENAIGSTENFDAKLEKQISSEDRLWQHISSRTRM